jgi:hypothetical protein
VKKLSVVLALLLIAVAGLSAQTYYGISVGMQNTTALLANNESLSTSSIALNVDSIVGDTICFILSTSIAMPSELTTKFSDGTTSEITLGSHIDIRFGADMFVGLGYRFSFGQAELFLGAGGGFNLLQLMSSTTTAGFQFMNYGFGGFATGAFNLSSNFQIYGGARYLYAPNSIVATNMEGWGFSAATTFLPHAGLKVRIR